MCVVYQHKMSTTLKSEDSNTPLSDKVRDFLQSKIQDLESKVIGLTQYSIEAGKQGELNLLNLVGDSVIKSLDLLSTLYLEYSFISEGEESVVYAHRAVSLDPEIQVSQDLSFLPDIIGIKGGDTAISIAKIPRSYFPRRTPGQIKILESFLDEIKSEAKGNGVCALDFHENRYSMILRGEIPDPYKYEESLSDLDDFQFELEKCKGLGNKTMGDHVLTYREDERRSRKRWKEGAKIPKVSFEQLNKIFSPQYPKHVIINEEALGGITLGDSIRYEPIDEICDNISLEISNRLPRRIDAYRFQSHFSDVNKISSEEINIYGIGKIKVQLSQNEIFTYIKTIESDSFSISNYRGSGRQYLNQLSEVALPCAIKIKPENIEVHLDHEWSGDIPFSEAERIASWLQKNVLDKIVVTPEYENQANEIPEAIQYPSSVGTLYTWLFSKKAEKLEITKYDPSKVYPHERAAISPGRGLFRLGIEDDLPGKAYNAFIWCGIGEPKPNSDAQEYIIPGYRMEGDLDSRLNKLVQINPKHGEEVFVVDYHPWSEYRGRAFKENLREMSKDIVRQEQLDEFVDRMYNLICYKPENPNIFGEDRTNQAREMGWELKLDNEQSKESSRVLARTLVPINEYKGNYQKPVVLISRDLSFDEVRIVPGVDIVN